MLPDQFRLFSAPPIRVLHQNEKGNNIALLGDHEGSDKENEERIPSPEVELCERIRRHGTDQDDQQRADQGNDQAVEQPARGVGRCEYAGVIAEIELLREPVRVHLEYLRGILEGAADQPVKRKQVQDGEKGDQDQQDHFTGGYPFDMILLLHGLTPLRLLVSFRA